MKKIYLLLTLFFAIILCSYVVASSNIFQNGEMNNKTIMSDIGDEDTGNNIIVEYDPDDDSVMTLYGGYPTTIISDSQSSSISDSQSSSISDSQSSSNTDSDSQSPSPDSDSENPYDIFYYPGGSARMKTYAA